MVRALIAGRTMRMSVSLSKDKDIYMPIVFRYVWELVPWILLAKLFIDSQKLFLW